MKKKLLLTLICAGMTLVYVNAQEDNDHERSGLGIALGAAVNYYYGQGDRNFGAFENDRVNWQLNGMLGITLARNKAGRRSMIAGFGTLGFNNRTTMNQLLADQGYTSTALEQAALNNFYQLEGGLLLADVFRISTGVGQQNFNTQTLVAAGITKVDAKHLKYYSSTVGFNLNLGSVAWTINANFAYGKDFERTVIIPNTGLMIHF